jgi:hypothetical protein
MKSLFIAGILFFIIPFFFIPNSYDKFLVENNGHLVKMRIEKLPASCIGAKVPYFVTFSYNGETYDKQTRGDFCDKHYVGELIEVKMLEGSKHVLFTNESTLFNLMSCGVLSLFGLFLSITQWKKIRNEI